MKKLFLAFAASSLLLAACNKDQATTNKLEGEWEITSYKWIGSSTTRTLIDGEMEFDDCKSTKEECSGKYELTYKYEDFFGVDITETDKQDIRYTVSQGGDKMFITFIDEDGYEFTTETEIELEKKELTIEYDDGDGDGFEMELEKK